MLNYREQLIIHNITQLTVSCIYRPISKGVFYFILHCTLNKVDKSVSATILYNYIQNVKKIKNTGKLQRQFQNEIILNVFSILAYTKQNEWIRYQQKYNNYISSKS